MTSIAVYPSVTMEIVENKELMGINMYSFSTVVRKRYEGNEYYLILLKSPVLHNQAKAVHALHKQVYEFLFFSTTPPEGSILDENQEHEAKRLVNLLNK